MFRDLVNNMHGRLEIYKKFQDGRIEKIFEDKNAITYRAKTIMSRILAGGFDPNSTPTYAGGVSRDFNFGYATANQLRITGMAFGNGGHLIYDNSTSLTNILPLTGGSIVDTSQADEDITLPAMPFISGTDWGYASTPDRATPGTTYEKVENGNVPWDGTINIDDNGIGVTEPNTTLYSETFRIPLDDTALSVDGYTYPTNTEVQFKATLDQAYLNYTGQWGFSASQANYISEAGLIVGYRPDVASLLTGQVYSNDGNEPGTGGGYTYLSGPATNFGTVGGKTDKDTGLFGTKNTLPPTVVNGVDTWTTLGDNTWNLVARKTFPVIQKSNQFSLLFVWTIGF